MANYTKQGIKEYQQNEFLLEDSPEEENWNNCQEDLAMDETPNFCDDDGWGDDWFNDDDEPDYPSNPAFPFPVHIKYPKKFIPEKDLRLYSAMLTFQNSFESTTANLTIRWRECSTMKEEYRLRQKEELLQKYVHSDYDPLFQDKSFIQID